MPWLTQFWIDLRQRFLYLFRRKRLDADLEEELRFHLEMREERETAKGRTAEDAVFLARRKFGNPSVIREVTREMWRFGSIETLSQDLRYAGRMLARTPGFTTVAILSLALGIGANAAIFSLVDRVMLRLLPVSNPQELVILAGNHSYPRYEQFRDRTQVFSGITGLANLSRIQID